MVLSSFFSTTPSAQRALAQLKKLKPNNGWTVEELPSTGQVRLLQRSIPLTDDYFYDIHYDTPSGNVVGIMTRTKPCKASVSVDAQGKTSQRPCYCLRQHVECEHDVNHHKQQNNNK